MIQMNALRYCIACVLLCLTISCSMKNNKKESTSKSVTENNNTSTVKPITVPPIEMKSLASTETVNKPISITADLAIPNKNEIPRLPKDFSIGDLGQGNVPLSVYDAARDYCNRLVSSQFSKQLLYFLPAQEQDKIAEIIKTINPLQYRIGGGRLEGEGRYSFLIRIIGQNTTASGAVYVRLVDTLWIVDDLLLEIDTKTAFDPLQYKYFL